MTPWGRACRQALPGSQGAVQAPAVVSAGGFAYRGRVLSLSAARWLLVLHAVLGAAAVAAATHWVIWLWPLWRGRVPRRAQTTSCTPGPPFAPASTRRTRPLCMKSMPSTMPTGRAVRKLPEITRSVEFAIGVLGRPCENAASISKRSWPAASCAQSRATASVMRMPRWKRDTCPLAASCSFTCGRNPCTSTSLMPMACRMARSCTKALSLPAAMASPARATTKVLPR